MNWKEFNWHFEGFEKQLARINAKKTMLDNFRPIPNYALKKIKESLSIEWTYHSNSIEGNILTLQETKLVIEEGMTIKGKSMREHLETLNHHDALNYIESLVASTSVIDIKTILEVHALVLQRIEKECTGRFRASGVRISGANFIPPNALKVSDLMDELIHWLQVESADLPIVVRVAIFHHRFVWIHPFFDGNGRTIRLIFNLILMQAGFPPAIILSNDRKKYYDALNKANTGDYSKLVLLTLQALERTIDIYLSNLNNDYESYQAISSIAEDPEIPYGQEYISLLVRQGKIDAFKEGRNWLTTKQAVKNYIAGRDRKRLLNSKS